MSSITLKEVLEKAACRISDEENLVYGELGSAMASLTKVLLEAMAESEVEKRVGVRLYERGDTRSDYRNGHRYRKVQTSHQVVDIEIPRLRGQGFVPSFLEPNRRAIAEVEGCGGKAFLKLSKYCRYRIFLQVTPSGVCNFFFAFLPVCSCDCRLTLLFPSVNSCVYFCVRLVPICSFLSIGCFASCRL